MRFLWQATCDVLGFVLALCFLGALFFLAWLYFFYHPSWLGLGIGIGGNIALITILWAGVLYEEAHDAAVDGEQEGSSLGSKE